VLFRCKGVSMMRSLLSKTEQRKLTIVEVLNQANDYVKFSELTDIVNTSERNLRENLNELKELSDILDVDLHYDRVQIEFHKNTGMESLTHHFINSNFSFNILEILFFDNSMQVEDLSDRLFVSPSTLYRYFNKIDKLLSSKFNLSLKTNPCRVEGEEREIRDFYITFFTEKYGIFDWPFEEIIPRESSHQLVEDTLDILDLTFDFTFKRHMRFVSAIALTRYKQNMYLGEDLNQVKLETIEKLTNGIDAQKYEAPLGLKIDQNVIYEMFMPFLNDNVLYSPDELITLAYSKQNISNSYFKALIICRDLSNKYKVPITNRDKLITGIHSTLYLGSSEPFSHYLVFDKKQ